MVGTGSTRIIFIMCGVEDGVGIWVGVSMLSQCWVHADGVEATREGFMEEVLQCCPCLQRERFPIVEVVGGKDARFLQYNDCVDN